MAWIISWRVVAILDLFFCAFIERIGEVTYAKETHFTCKSYHAR